VRAEELAIWEINGDALILLDSFGIDQNEWERVPLDREAGLVGLVAETGQRYVQGEADLVGAGREEKSARVWFRRWISSSSSATYSRVSLATLST